MPVIQAQVSIAAATSNNNLINGSNYEFARTRQVVSIGFVAAAADTFISIQSGSDTLLEESSPLVLTTFPIVPDHMYYNDVMEIGDRLKLAARNPTVGAVVHRALVQINPM